MRIDGRRKMDNALIDNSIIRNPTKYYTPSVKDEKTLEVVLFSEIQDGKELHGLLIESKTSCVLNFTEDGKVQKIMHNLMSISTDVLNGKRLTVAGDSGAWVRTKETNEVIGMVIGAKDDKTYVMPMEKILDACEKNLTIKLTILINENDEKIPN